MTINLSKIEINNIVETIQIKQLDDIKQIVLFIGHAHSGHSIIGSILDAHPDVAIANEINIVKAIKDFKLTKREIESILLHYSLKNQSELAWYNSEYRYKLHNSIILPKN